MARRHFEIGTYRIYYRPYPINWAFPGGFVVELAHGYIDLRSKKSSDTAYLPIVANSVDAIPENKTLIYGSRWIGIMGIRHEDQHEMIDLLRHEKPLYVTLFDKLPISNTISSSEEPVGEGTDISI